MKLTDLLIADAIRLISQRKLSPVELTRAYLERIERLDPGLNSFITVAADAAMERAMAAERFLMQKRPPAPLHGIPLAHKDLFDTRGIRNTAGSTFLADYVPDQDAPIMANLHDAGAVTLGKLNLDEFAVSVRTNNPHYGACRNPWNVDRIPGGSSGGSAVALAARLCLGSMGSDSAGSIRIPAALCGVVGLKPTFGRISRRGTWPFSWSFDHVGPMARCVHDVGLLLNVTAGFDREDPFAADRPVEDYLAGLEAGVSGWRIMVAYRAFYPATKEADPQVLAAVEEAVKEFERMGARVDEGVLDGAWEATRATLLMIMSDAAALHRDRLKEREEGFGEETRQSLQRGARTSAMDYALARRKQALFRRRMETLFQRYDLLITPTVGSTAPPLAETLQARKRRPSLVSYTAPFNLAGLPALSVPCGFTSDGMPVGLQIVGPAWSEARILRAARAYERATGWQGRQPPLDGGD